VVSFVDPDARWGHEAPDKPFCGSQAPESLAPDSRLIVDGVPGTAHEAVRTDALLARAAPPLAAGTVLIADGLSNNAPTVEQVEAAGARPRFAGLRAERVSVTVQPLNPTPRRLPPASARRWDTPGPVGEPGDPPSGGSGVAWPRHDGPTMGDHPPPDRKARPVDRRGRKPGAAPVAEALVRG
jgi:hypothetical protein